MVIRFAIAPRTRSVEHEVGPAEGAIGACRLVPDRDVRRDLTEDREESTAKAHGGSTAF